MRKAVLFVAMFMASVVQAKDAFYIERVSDSPLLVVKGETTRIDKVNDSVILYLEGNKVFNLGDGSKISKIEEVTVNDGDQEFKIEGVNYSIKKNDKSVKVDGVGIYKLLK